MAATGTPTPNIGLRRAQGTDPASVDDINYNSELLDTKLGAVGNTSVQEQINALSASTAQTFGNVQDGLAIVSNGNTHVAIPAGYWVYVKGHGTLSEGLYKNTSGATIAANATLSTSNLTADPDGGLNSVYDALNSKFGALKFLVSSVTGNGSKTITIGNDTRCEITIIGGSVNVLDKVIVNCSGTGTVNFKQTENTSAITVTSDINSLTITNTNGITSGLYIFVYVGTVTV